MEYFAETTLPVILPPSNIAKNIISIKNNIFSETGLYSAVALPPFIPLGITSDRKDIFNSLNIKHSWEISTAGFINYENSIFLEVRHQDNNYKKITNTKEKESVIPLFPGFFICSLINQINQAQSMNYEDLIKKINKQEEIKFRSFSVGLLKIQFSSDNLWDEVYWEIEEEKKLRKPE